MTNSCQPGWLGERLALRWKFIFLFMDLLKDWLPAGCGGWFGWLGVCLGLGLGLGCACRVGWPWRGGRAVGVAPGPEVRCADCAAVLTRGAVARKLAALCLEQSSAQTAAPSLRWKCAGRRTRPTACAPRHRPSRLPHGPPATPLGRRVGVRRLGIGLAVGMTVFETLLDYQVNWLQPPAEYQLLLSSVYLFRRCHAPICFAPVLSRSHKESGVATKTHGIIRKKP